MKKALFALTLCLMAALSACGGTQSQGNASASLANPNLNPNATVEQPIPGREEKGLISLTETELHGALDEVCYYYFDSPYLLTTITEIPAVDGEVSFVIACTKDGEEQPNRTISLSRYDDCWEVVGEG